MQTKYKYINFQLVPGVLNRKTNVYHCHNNHSGGVLGEVRWYGPWRQYCFYTMGFDSIFNGSCLADIQHFLSQLMNERGGKP